MILGKEYFIKKIKTYALKDNIWPIVVGTSTYSLELLAAWRECNYFYCSQHWDHFNPEKADVLIISGHVNKVMLQNILDIYQRMPEYKKVLVVGTLNVKRKSIQLKDHLKVDVVVEGDPPTKEDILQGFTDIYRCYQEAFFLS